MHRSSAVAYWTHCRARQCDKIPIATRDRHLISHPTVPVNATAKEKEAHGARIGRINKFKRILQTSSVSLNELKDLAWSGIPTELRATIYDYVCHLYLSLDICSLERARQALLPWEALLQTCSIIAEESSAYMASS